ncbi:MAG: glycosyltransferase, partial [Methylomonas sp.]
MAKALYAAGFDVTFQFTGRPADKYFDMEIFGDYQVKAGLTFNTNKGQVSYLKTALEEQPISFMRDIKALDLSGYDLVISDFEPVTAWAAKLQGIKTIGIGHQYAFNYEIPKAGSDFLGEKVLR